MPNGQDDNLTTVVAIQRNVCALTKLNHPFAKIRGHLLNRLSNLWMHGEQFHTGANGPDGAFCSSRTLPCQKTMEPNYVAECSLRPPQGYS